jgi:hypothetical protein
VAELTSIQGGAVLVATATFFGALVGSYAPQWFNRRMQKRNLRKSLIAEIQQGGLGFMNGPTLADFGTTDDVVPTEIYKANSDRVGLLSENEAEAVIRYYSKVSTLNAYGRMYRNTDVEHDFILHQIDEVNSAQKDAITFLTENEDW